MTEKTLAEQVADLRTGDKVKARYGNVTVDVWVCYGYYRQSLDAIPQFGPFRVIDVPGEGDES
ncbi:hypothetical protein EK0264_03645 [Epidermidibacterium keratini]|uniref:Uncharacterized protein n=1 Tax=Epidermidibacterium keratini TaxID=1891644 RepID=A0A7L4YKU4_9ACTN|nr:hypothetical protein [Epidermidibacterium keratini]QHB99463.1 hypothetical protein EK0264_03645 [Epidermidibacterium keratini]